MYRSISCSRAARSPPLVVGAQEVAVALLGRRHAAPFVCIGIVKSTQAPPSSSSTR